MTPELSRGGQLPIVLAPAADELLSSWIYRHAAFYDVPPLAMLRHCLNDISSLRAVDLRGDGRAIVSCRFYVQNGGGERSTNEPLKHLAKIPSTDRRQANAVLCELLAPIEFEWTRACTTKSTSRMASHLPPLWFAAYR